MNMNANYPCLCAPLGQNISAEEFQKSLKEIVVNKKDTSKYKRSKISAVDERTSSKAIGMVAIVFIVVPFSVLILSDVPTLASQLIKTYKQITNRFKIKKKSSKKLSYFWLNGVCKNCLILYLKRLFQKRNQRFSLITMIPRERILQCYWQKSLCHIN